MVFSHGLAIILVIFVKTEKESQSTSIGSIEALVGNQLYVKGGMNTSVSQVLVDGNDCEISINISGIQNISLGDCLNDTTTNTPEVVIVLNDRVISKKIYLKDKTIFTSSVSSSGESFNFITNCNSTPIFNSGDGSEGNPYEICSCTQLQNMSLDLAANYELIADINCTETRTWNWNGSHYNGFQPVGYCIGNCGLGGDDFFLMEASMEIIIKFMICLFMIFNLVQLLVCLAILLEEILIMLGFFQK